MVAFETVDNFNEEDYRRVCAVTLVTILQGLRALLHYGEDFELQAPYIGRLLFFIDWIRHNRMDRIRTSSRLYSWHSTLPKFNDLEFLEKSNKFQKIQNPGDQNSAQAVIRLCESLDSYLTNPVEYLADPHNKFPVEQLEILEELVVEMKQRNPL